MNPHPSSRSVQPVTRSLGKRLVIVRVGIAAALAMLSALLFVPAPADAQAAPARDGAMEAGFLSALNQQRASRGVAPLSLLPSMSSAAGGWTTQMVNGSFLAHASNIKPGVPSGWSKIGENVGRGKSVGSLTQSFMASPGHARNVLDPDFTHVGIAVIVHPTGRVYTTHRFAALGTRPAAVAPVAPPAPAPTAPPAPVAAPAPAAAVPPAPVAPPAPAVAAPPAPAAPPVAAVPVAARVEPTPTPPPAPPAIAPVAPSQPAAASTAPAPAPTRPPVNEVRLNAATIPSWDNIDHVRAAAARKLATVRGARQPGRAS